MNKKRIRSSHLSCVPPSTSFDKGRPDAGYFLLFLLSPVSRYEDCYCFVSPLFYILPLSFSICPIILTTSSEYWPPNLPGQPVFSSKFRTIFSRLLDISTIITSFQCMLIWGFILITLPSQSLLVSPLYLLYNIKVIRV